MTYYRRKTGGLWHAFNNVDEPRSLCGRMKSLRTSEFTGARPLMAEKPDRRGYDICGSCQRVEEARKLAIRYDEWERERAAMEREQFGKERREIEALHDLQGGG